MKFTEEKLEQVFIEILEDHGYQHVKGDDIIRDPDQVIIEADLKSFLLSKYENETLTENEADQIIRQLKSFAATYSGPNLPLIPEHACHLFRRKAATHSG